MTASRLPQPSTNPGHLRKAERSSGTEFRTFSFTYRDADDLRIPTAPYPGRDAWPESRPLPVWWPHWPPPARAPVFSAGPTTRPTTPRQGGRHERQARFGRRRPPDQGEGQGREERHHDGRHRARRDRAGRRPAGRREGRPCWVGRTTSSATYAPPCRPRRPTRPSRRPRSCPPSTASTSSRRSCSTTRRPRATGPPGRRRRPRAPTRRPARSTPAKNPYNPSFETGAVDFVKQNPKADGRGVTIGILDSGVDLGHPALQKTTTGERKIVDWVTATDPVTDGDAHLAADDTPR